MDKLICVVGPTASGKTALAVRLAKALDGEVVSCDSMQIYRRMDVGTAKPAAEEMDGVPHHMIGIADPAEDFSVGVFLRARRRGELRSLKKRSDYGFREERGCRNS